MKKIIWVIVLPDMKNNIVVIISIIIVLFLIGKIISINNKKTQNLQSIKTIKDINDKENIVKGQVTLSGEENGEVVVPEINIWNKPGSGSQENVVIGKIPNGTVVDLLDTKEIGQRTYYLVRSGIGKISRLSKDWNERGKQMETLSANEWFEEASVNQPITGWVVDTFIRKSE